MFGARVAEPGGGGHDWCQREWLMAVTDGQVEAQ